MKKVRSAANGRPERRHRGAGGDGVDTEKNDYNSPHSRCCNGNSSAIPQTSGFINQMMNASSPLGGSALSFSPDGRVLASASGFTANIVLRDVSTGQELRTLKTTSVMNVVTVLAWSADGRRLASAQWGFKGNLADPNAPPDKVSFDDMAFSIKVWDAQNGAELNSLTGHANFVYGLAFSRDGRMLASGSFDSTIKLWDLTTGRELRTLKGHTGPIAAVDISADGRFVVSGSDNGQHTIVERADRRNACDAGQPEQRWRTGLS